MIVAVLTVAVLTPPAHSCKLPVAKLLDLDAPAAEQARIDGPGARPEEGKAQADGCPQQLNLDRPIGAQRDAEYFKGINIRNQYADLKVIGLDKVDGRDAFVIEAKFPDSHPAKTFGINEERLYFDVQTGLLLRRGDAGEGDKKIPANPKIADKRVNLTLEKWLSVYSIVNV